MITYLSTSSVFSSMESVKKYKKNVVTRCKMSRKVLHFWPNLVIIKKCRTFHRYIFCLWSLPALKSCIISALTVDYQLFIWFICLGNVLLTPGLKYSKRAVFMWFYCAALRQLQGMSTAQIIQHRDIVLPSFFLGSRLILHVKVSRLEWPFYCLIYEQYIEVLVHPAKCQIFSLSWNQNYALL